MRLVALVPPLVGSVEVRSLFLPSQCLFGSTHERWLWLLSVFLPFAQDSGGYQYFLTLSASISGAHLYVSKSSFVLRHCPGAYLRGRRLSPPNASRSNSCSACRQRGERGPGQLPAPLRPFLGHLVPGTHHTCPVLCPSVHLRPLALPAYFPSLCRRPAFAWLADCCPCYMFPVLTEASLCPAVPRSSQLYLDACAFRRSPAVFVTLDNTGVATPSSGTFVLQIVSECQHTALGFCPWLLPSG